jgi:sugar phosphate isomerase/epimerase
MAKNILLALSTGSLPYLPLSNFFRIAKEVGFEGVEVRIEKKFKVNPCFLKMLSKKFELPIVSLHAPYARFPWQFSNKKLLKETFFLAQEVKIPLIVVHPPKFWNIGDILWFKKFALHFAQLKRKRIILSVENMGRVGFFGLHFNPTLYNTVEELARFPVITFDVTHFASLGYDIFSAYLALKDKVKHIHLSNFDGCEHLLPQDGKLPLGKFISLLLRERFSGALVVEVAPKAFRKNNAVDIKETLWETVNFCNYYLKRGRR